VPQLAGGADPGQFHAQRDLVIPHLGEDERDDAADDVVEVQRARCARIRPVRRPIDDGGRSDLACRSPGPARSTREKVADVLSSIGLLGVPRPRLGGYVTRMGPRTGQPLPEVLVLKGNPVEFPDSHSTPTSSPVEFPRIDVSGRTLGTR
jgi:hypothetical protein